MRTVFMAIGILGGRITRSVLHITQLPAPIRTCRSKLCTINKQKVAEFWNANIDEGGIVCRSSEVIRSSLKPEQ